MGRLSPDEREMSLLTLLRRATSTAHDDLETVMGLSPDSISRERVTELLLAFAAFYRQWEDWIRRSPLDADFVRTRLKGASISRDLGALGVADIPDSHGPMRLGEPSLPYAFGSMYVVEGSTLGGQVINRWLAGADWLPANGLTYFASYGPRVGAMWRSFRAQLEESCRGCDPDVLVAGAQATFSELERRFRVEERAA